MAFEEKYVTTETLEEGANAGVQKAENMIKLLSDSLTDMKKAVDEKIVKVPLLERKMNKWIRVFEQSEKDNNHRGTDTSKKIHEIHEEIHKIQG